MPRSLHISPPPSPRQTPQDLPLLGKDELAPALGLDPGILLLLLREAGVDNGLYIQFLQYNKSDGDADLTSGCCPST